MIHLFNKNILLFLIFFICSSASLQSMQHTTEVYNEIALARTTECFKELLALKRRQDVAGTDSEKIITQAIVELMGGIYPIPSLAELAFIATACHLGTLQTWDVLNENINDTKVNKDLRSQLIKYPVNFFNDTLLHIFTSNKDERAVSELLTLGANPNAYNIDQERPLDIAHVTGNNTLIEILRKKTNSPIIKEESSPSRFSNGFTNTPFSFAMKWAFASNKVSSIMKLIHHHTTVPDQSGTPPLLSDVSIVQTLCSQYVQHWTLMSDIIQDLPLLQSPSAQQKLFLLALNHGNVPLAKQFILHGRDLDDIDIYHIIQSSENLTLIIPILELLKKAGVNLQDKLFNPQILRCLFFATSPKNGIGLFCKFLKENLYSCDLSAKVIYENQRYENSREHPLTLLEESILYANPSIVNYVFSQAAKPLVLSAKTLTYFYRHKQSDLHKSFLMIFLNLITTIDLILEERLETIEQLSQWVAQQQNDSSHESCADYETFLTFCNFNQKTFNFCHPDALNLCLKYKCFPLLDIIYNRALASNRIFEKSLNSNSFESLFHNTQSQSHKSSVNSNFIDKFLCLLAQKPSYEQTPFHTLTQESPYSPIHLLLLNTFEWDLEKRFEWIKKIIEIYPELKTKPDFYGNTPLDLINKNADLLKNEELVAFFSSDKFDNKS